MISMLQNPYVLVIVTTLLTAALVTLYNRTLDADDTSKATRSGYKILAIGTVVGVLLAFLANRGMDDMLDEPYLNGEMEF